jgi:hypothetical protein
LFEAVLAVIDEETVKAVDSSISRDTPARETERDLGGVEALGRLKVRLAELVEKANWMAAKRRDEGREQE